MFLNSPVHSFYFLHYMKNELKVSHIFTNDNSRNSYEFADFKNKIKREQMNR